MNNQSLISVIVPTFNQRKNIPVLLHLLFQLPLNLEVIVVDDSSPDKTYLLVQTLQTTFPKLKLLQRQGKLGLGTAYMDGLKLCQGQFVIIMDADLSHLPHFIPKFVQKQQQTNADIVTGTRYSQGGGVSGWPFMRKLISRTANFITNQLFWSNFSDLTGSFRLYRTSVLKDLLPLIKSRGYSFQMQVLIRSWKKGLKIEEVGIVFVERIFGQSKLGGGQIVKFIGSLWRLLFQLQ